MNTSARQQAAAIARKVLEAWKPYAWGSALAPEVDLSPDVDTVVEHWDEIRSPEAAARVVADAFAASHPDRREQFDCYTCTSVGTKLYRELHAAGLTPPRDPDHVPSRGTAALG